MQPFKRSTRVSDLIRQEVSEAILYKLKDPRLGFITVTEVDMPDDLKLARVYISVLDRETKDVTLEILNKASSFIRKEIGRHLKLRTVPKIEFFNDNAIDYGMKMDALIDNVTERHNE
ncbi:MAG: 30S ribosome-binding factor RbfA [Nitrospirae bacterium]|nr:30S ribosome-binding factor RbfA [Nitrospirota bacterium]MBF0542041.1 30S ribosome-binding factor RbfA [Nitrospirota bacterium]